MTQGTSADEILANIRTIGVLGAGQMGAGIAQVAAQAGYRVLLADVDQARADAGKAGIAKQLGRLVEKGKLQEAERAAIVERITAVVGAAGLAPSDFAVEAATENIELKKKLFRELDAALGDGAVLATNTSSISITLLAAQTRRPDRVVGMHFMNPVPLMKLVEIIRGLQTADGIYGATVALAQKLGKTTITSKDCPGFLVNRVLIPLINEACFALQEGLGTPEDIDTGAKLGLNHPMGPLELADLIGLDTCLAIADVLHRELGDDKYRAANVLRMHVAAGWHGRKTGRGFYDYASKGK
ncbi:3-hydroxyacyl-CoA dehydrogenase NAD-binding domain-containing protein [Nannocystis bainbridge]|uniref:3-hydroxyacyl-CoA dehydrogenase NAD-binding domain-containing protein n=1 Tax=Nannocystis bainbridge TaxID=2995303 RepID=A0ABT5DNU1_9BACT|nr:3-hydroxyacyl-CoA dehydrogenase NAD-binding domain-containing protein [Nannocystis bainbridge]MDC0715268.1 3-hydroxyacyl-CoA dehydrogenase NAD-binding domain-containing protein [Nannocystis bainbridge]